MEMSTNLPDTIKNSNEFLTNLLKVMDVPRDILPSADDIGNVGNQLPSMLAKIQPSLRSEKIAKMCVAISVGLFDSAVNYIWNQTVIELRRRVVAFGLNVVKELKQKTYSEQDIDEMSDAQLLDLTHELELINDEGFYFLSQCRDIRNNFSAAHPSMGEIDQYELLSYINRCIKYSLSINSLPKGVDLKAFIDSLNQDAFSNEQVDFWVNKIKNTSSQQRNALMLMLFGIYCDPDKSGVARANAIMLAEKLKDDLSEKSISEMINRHEEYSYKNTNDKRKASEDFFIKIGMFDCLSTAVRHTIISKACAQLESVHYAMNNFYNEPVFAEHLYNVSKQAEIPNSTKKEFVEVVTNCAIGNQYGVSNVAEPYYDKMIKNFSPIEIKYMLEMPGCDNYVAHCLKNFQSCKQQYGKKLRLLNPTLMDASLQNVYNSLLRKFPV
jgi:hypothetical protein